MMKHSYIIVALCRILEMMLPDEPDKVGIFLFQADRTVKEIRKINLKTFPEKSHPGGLYYKTFYDRNLQNFIIS